MYRIALQLTAATANKPATYQFLTADNGIEPWETADEREGLNKFCSELDNYKRSLLTLVNVVNVKCHCEDADNIDSLIEFATSTLKVTVNNGTDFIAKLDLSDTSLADYTSVAFDEEATAEPKAALEALGLTNVIFTKSGITATNPTGSAVTGSILMSEGIWRLYSETTRKDNYISSAFSFIIE